MGLHERTCVARVAGNGQGASRKETRGGRNHRHQINRPFNLGRPFTKAEIFFLLFSRNEGRNKATNNMNCRLPLFTPLFARTLGYINVAVSQTNKSTPKHERSCCCHCRTILTWGLKSTPRSYLSAFHPDEVAHCRLEYTLRWRRRSGR